MSLKTMIIQGPSNIYGFFCAQRKVEFIEIGHNTSKKLNIQFRFNQVITRFLLKSVDPCVFVI